MTQSIFDTSRLSSEEIDELVSKHLSETGTIYKLDIDAFKEAEPDIAITQQLCEVCAVAYNDVLTAVNSSPKRPLIISLDPTSLGDVLNDIIRIGEASDRRNEADEFVSKLKERINRVAQTSKGAGGRPRVLCLEWLDPPMTSGHWIPEMVELAGGRDELGSRGKPARKSNWEKIALFDPDKVLLMPCGFDLPRCVSEEKYLERRPEWRGLRAVKAGEVYALDGNSYYSRSGPRLVDGLEIMAKVLHPELFGPVEAELAARIAP